MFGWNHRCQEITIKQLMIAFWECRSCAKMYSLNFNIYSSKLANSRKNLATNTAYCFARYYYHGTDISMITENHSFSSSISFYSMIKVSFPRQSFYRLISSSWNVACNKFSVLELCIMWIFNRVHGNTFPWYCWFGANN